MELALLRGEGIITADQRYALTEFLLFHRDNKDVWRFIVEYADEARQKKRHIYSIEDIISVIRWHTDKQTRSTDGFKINNNHKPFYARCYMAYRECEGFFATRDSKADNICYRTLVEMYFN